MLFLFLAIGTVNFATAQNGYTTPTDVNGNGVFDFQEVTNLAIACPGDVSVANDPGNCSASVSIDLPVITGFCGTYVLTNDFNGVADASGSYPVGTTTVKFIAVDDRSDTARCSIQVTVVDNTAPVIATCPGDIYLFAGAACDALTTWAAPTVSDNCSGSSIAQTAGPASGSAFPLGTTTVAYTSTDAAGNTASCSFDVIVADNTAPVIICPANVTATTNSGCTATGVALGTPSTSDNCGVASVVNDSPAAFPIGTTIVTWTVTDNSGNVATCMQTVTVSDNILPTITCPSNVTATTNTGCTATGVVLGVPITNDNCGVASVVSDAPAAFPIGATTVTWTVTDNSGNVATCMQTVTVSDNIPPVTVCQPTTIFLNATGIASLTTADIDGGSTDNCGITSIVPSQTTFSCSVAGANSVTLTVTDNSGNSSTCTASVTVLDTIHPVAVCQPVTIGLDAFGNGDVTATQVDGGSSDNCGVTSLALTTGQYYAVGTYADTLIATDAAGNAGTCIATITVVDHIPPVAVCKPHTLYLNNAGQAILTGNDIDGGSYDNGTIVSLVPSQVNFNCYHLGTNNIALSVTDAGGNTNICLAVVTVLDTIAPMAQCQPLIVQLNASGTASITPAQVNNGSTDNCTVASMSLDANSFDCTNLGTNTVTLTVTDNSGNSSTCTALVTVEDLIAPTITCPANVTATTNTGCTATGVALGTPTFADNCSGNTVSNNAPAAFPIGTTTVTWTVTDASGNTATCNQTVIVTDNVSPVAVCQPATIYLNAAGTASIVAADIDGGSSDNCGIASIVPSQTTFSCSAAGANAVTLTVTDNSGNSSTCTASVTVLDTIHPVAVCQPVTIGLDAFGNADVTATQVDGGSSDNCGVTSLTLTTGQYHAVGTYTDTLIVTDATGNVDSCFALITVVDNNPPVAVCQPATIYLDAAGNASIFATDLDGGSTDNGMIVSFGASQTAFDCSNAGTNNVTFTATDAGGNSSSCVAVVIVLDTIAPAANCQSITVALDATGTAVLTGVMFNNGTSDNCGTGSITYSVDIPSPSSAGTYAVILTASDASGNSSTCPATLTVIDTIAPLAVCQDTSIYLDGSGTATITPAMINGGSTDNDTITGISASQLSFDCSHLGANYVSLTVTDASGNSSSCVAIAIVLDTIAPSVVCQGLSVDLDANGIATLTPQTLDNGSTDNCGGLLTYTSSDSSFTDVGSYNVVLTVTDPSGNSSTCQAMVVVNDLIPPVAVCQPDTLYLDPSGNASLTAVDINGSSTDNGTIVDYTASQTDFDCSNMGTNAVTLTVTDAAGNSDHCSTTVTVLDTIAPTIVCQSITVQLDGNGVAVINALQIDGGTTDNCGTGPLSFSASQTTFTSLGSYTVTLTVTDASGNSSTCDATVSVTDTEPPVAICQPDTIYLDNNGAASITALDINSASTDNDTIVSYAASQDNFDCTDLGANNVVLTVTDAGGNTDNCTAIVTVMDTIAPVAVCQNITVTLPPSGQVAITGAQLNNGSTDNCGSGPLNFTASTTLFVHVGIFPDTLFVTDASGNTSYCISTVTVTDLIAPVAICKPYTIYLDNIGAANIIPADIDGGSTDNGTIIAMTASQTAFNCSNIGTNNVTLIVSDEAENNAFCTSVVTVLDTIAPSAVCQSITIAQGAGGTTAVTGAMINNGSTDNCGNALSYTVDQATLQGTGSFTVMLTVTDASGNSSTCESTVTVGDDSPPLAVCQPITVYVGQNGNVTITGEDIDGGSTDNDSIVSYVANPNTFNCANLGLNTSVLTVIDNTGNTDLCVAQVTVLDTIAPTVICQNITVPIGPDGTATITAMQINNGTTDNCASGLLTYTASQTYFTGTGIYTDTLTVTDASGNTSYCIATVTVNDVTSPITICQDTTIYLDGNGNASISANNLDGGTTDNGGSVIFTASQTVFDCDELGSNQVVLSATDAFGNVGTCTALVTVIDTIAPEAICQNIDVVMDFFGNAMIEGIDIDGGSTDNCGAGALTYATDITNFTAEGTFTVTLTVNDAGGNSNTCTGEVSVAQPVKPLKIPSGFSPNGDGIADTWEIQGLREFPNNSVVIFNRWGGKLFEAKPYLNDWAGQATEGTLPGKLPAGTYFYQLDLGNGDLRTGYLQVNR